MSSGNWMRYLKKIKPYTIKKGFRYLKHYGPKEFWVRLCERMEPEEVPYGPWFESHKPTEKELEAQRKKQWKKQPLISVVVPAYKTPEKFLREMIKSLEAQTYTNWELCIANASPEDTAMAEVHRERCQSKSGRSERKSRNRGKYECRDGDGSRGIYRAARS